jgi:hypothetical protein
MACISAEWFAAIANGVMALAAVGAVGYAGRELDQRRRERRDDALDAAARDILIKSSRAWSSFNDAMLKVENAVSGHLVADSTVADRNDLASSVLRTLGEADPSYQELQAALFLGRAIWGQRFKEVEAEVQSAHFDLLIWGLGAHSICGLPPDEESMLPHAQDARFKKFSEKLHRFRSAVDALGDELGQFLHGGRKDSEGHV